MMVINITLFVFNLIPIPPLDGSKFLFTLLSHPKHYRTRMMLELRGPMLLILFILADNFMLGGRIMGTLFGAVLAVLAGVFHL
jgi:Zn-dependent protease